MAQARSSAVTATAAMRVQVIAPPALGATAVAALRARGIDAKLTTAPLGDDDVIAWALETPPSTARAVELAAACNRAAEAGRPIVLLSPPARGSGRPAIERAAALSYLRAQGAALSHDVDAWLEAVVMLVRYGLPQGPRAAVIAPEGSWLAAQATAIALDAEAVGARTPLAAPDEPTDVVLYDPELGKPPRSTPGLHVPVVPRRELAEHVEDALFSARAALGAVEILGAAAERIAVGLGPAPQAASAELAIDVELRTRQMVRNQRDFASSRIGDHETKTLLRSYGVPITRQGVAMTPSAAVKLAREIGYPVEVKMWGPTAPTEPAGCPIEKNVTSDALIRQAFATITLNAWAGSPRHGVRQEQVEAAIVRETPPSGRDVTVSFVKLPDLGWTVVLDGPHVAAAPAPLRLIDAQLLAAHVVSSRSGESDLDRAGLANVMRRASHLVVDLDSQLARLDLPRVVVGGRGARTVVVDAFAELL
jgi:hypothetical protein